MTHLEQKLGLAEDVQNHVGGTDGVGKAVDLVPGLAMVVALIPVGHVPDGQELPRSSRRLRVAQLGQLARSARPTQGVRVEPLDFRLGIAVEDAGQLRVAAHRDRLGAARVDLRGRIEHVELHVRRQGNAVGVLGETLEDVLVELSRDPLELQDWSRLARKAQRVLLA